MQTVYVIGAGSSSEVRLPTGEQLKAKIADALDMEFDDWAETPSGDALLRDAILPAFRTPDYFPNNINPYLIKARQIRDAMPLAISIDNYLDAHRHDRQIEVLGKLAIVRTILAAEKDSDLYFVRDRQDSNLDFLNVSDAWLNLFFRSITENCMLEDLPERLNQISLIVFNYDRCIEHFLFCAFRTYYGVSEQVALDLLRQVEIHHPYGDVGEYGLKRGAAVAFGETPSPSRLVELSNRIRTFSEGTHPDSDIDKIRSCVADAHRLIFMGFAFHKINMEVLTPEPEKRQKRTIPIYASSLGISGSDLPIVEAQLRNMSGHSIVLNTAQLTCHDCMNEFWRGVLFS